MKRVIIIIVALAVLMLGLAAPERSEANDSWVPAAIVGGIVIGAAISQAMDPGPVHVYQAPSAICVQRPPARVYVHRPPARIYVNPHHRMNKCKEHYWHGEKYRDRHNKKYAGPCHNRRHFHR
ncbi:MAG: hypothetical protein M0P57_01210 [Syntrophales bacterium]|jgi:hypothetical protein|nr:hypothetical protein [Syntrophales bacterium]MDY0043136.1 hypothetical protein [Syntrophales bacterium]